MMMLQTRHVRLRYTLTAHASKLELMKMRLRYSTNLAMV